VRRYRPKKPPGTLGDLPLMNRMVMPPLTRTREDNPELLPNDLIREYYVQRASAGLIISEGIWASQEGICQPNVPGLCTEDQASVWKTVTDAIHEKGGRIFATLAWRCSLTSRPLSRSPDTNRSVGNQSAAGCPYTARKKKDRDPSRDDARGSEGPSNHSESQQ